MGPKQQLVRTISFSGMDGAGKSTQINRLCARLATEGRTFRLIPFWDEVARFKGLREKSGHVIFKGDRGVGSPERPINRRDKNVQSPLMSCVRLFLYLVDGLSMWRVATQAMRSNADVVIFDRYTYDELANLNLANPLMRLYARFLMKIVPKPDVSLVLDADPIAARKRKPEYPVEFLAKCRMSYRALANLIGGITIIAPGSVDEVTERILSSVFTESKAIHETPTNTPARGEATQLGLNLEAR